MLGQNFLLFGTVTAVDAGTNTLTVQVTSGNHLVQVYMASATAPLVINVTPEAVIRQLGEASHLITLAEVPVNSYVRVHGGFMPGTTVEGETPTPAAWNATQVYVENQNNTDVEAPEGSEVPESSETPEPES